MVSAQLDSMELEEKVCEPPTIRYKCPTSSVPTVYITASAPSPATVLSLLLLSFWRHMYGTWRQGEQGRRRTRVEEERLRYHYILYMSKMPGRLLPASPSVPCWESIWVFEYMHTLCIFLPPSLLLSISQDFRFLKWIYPTGSLRAAPISHCCTERWREVEGRQDREQSRGGERLCSTFGRYLQSFICVFFLINCCYAQALLAAQLM